MIGVGAARIARQETQAQRLRARAVTAAAQRFDADDGRFCSHAATTTDHDIVTGESAQRSLRIAASKQAPRLVDGADLFG